MNLSAQRNERREAKGKRALPQKTFQNYGPSDQRQREMERLKTHY